MVEPSLRQLEMFAALRNHPTLRSAAAHLRISESALSQAVTNLERIVGEQLCVRRKAVGLTLTPTGQQFAHQASKIVDDAHELVLGSRQDQELRGPVKLGCYDSFATNIVPELLEGFPRRHPGVWIDVTVGTNEELLDGLNAGRLDVALLFDVSLPLGYRRRRIFATQLHAHLHPDHPLARQDSVDLAELADEPYIFYDATPGAQDVTDAFTLRGLEPNIVVRVTQIALVEALVGRGMGYGLLMSRPNTLSMSNEGRPVVIRPLDPPATSSHVVGLWPEDMEPTARASAVLDFAAERFAST